MVLLRKIWVALLPNSYLLKTRLSNGAVVFGANKKGFGGRGIFIFRESIEPEFNSLESFLEPSDVLIDVGANTGIYSLKAAKYFQDHKGEGTVVSVEPSPPILAILYHSIQYNKFHNIRLRNFCAGDTTHPAIFWRNFNKPNSFSLVKIDENASSFSTLIVSLDDLFEWEQLKTVSFIKIDAEGAEQQVLTGAKKIIEKYRPIIMVEITIEDIPVDFSNYSVFQASGSPNKMYIPNESAKIKVAEKLGWKKLAG